MHTLCRALQCNIPTAFGGSVQDEISESGFATVKYLTQVSNKTCHPSESLLNSKHIYVSYLHEIICIT